MYTWVGKPYGGPPILGSFELGNSRQIRLPPAAKICDMRRAHCGLVLGGKVQKNLTESVCLCTEIRPSSYSVIIYKIEFASLVC